MGLGAFEEKEPYILVRPIQASDTPETISIAIADARTLRIDKIIVSTDDTSDVLLHLRLDDGMSDVGILGSLLLPAGSGVDPAVPPKDLLAAADLDGLGIVLPNNATLTVEVPVALTSGKYLYVTSIGGTF